MQTASARRPCVERAQVAFLRACRLDVEVRKPGNVSVASPGHGMDAGDVHRQREAAAPALFAPARAVGERIERAVEASCAAAGCNTNLGIVLLAAPIARALEAPGAAQSAPALRSALSRGAARRSTSATRAPPTAPSRAPTPAASARRPSRTSMRRAERDLLEAMRLAADRDRIARQYAERLRRAVRRRPAGAGSARRRRRRRARRSRPTWRGWPALQIHTLFASTVTRWHTG